MVTNHFYNQNFGDLIEPIISKTGLSGEDAEKEKNTATLSKISNAIKGSEKLDVEGTDLLELLSHLEGELQARDVAIAALKSEQTKRIIYGCLVGSDQPASPLSASRWWPRLSS